MSDERLKLGFEAMLSKRPKINRPSGDQLPRPKYRANWQTMPGTTGVTEPRVFEYALEAGDSRVELVNDALGQLYVVFGAPGVGKSYLLRKLLEQLANASAWRLPWGGLLLDPKQTLISDIKSTIPRDQLHVIGPAAGTTMNLLASHLEPTDLGTALALAAQSAGIAAHDPYWINEMKRLFGDGLMILKLLEPWSTKPMSLSGLAELFLGGAVGKMEKTPMQLAFDNLTVNKRVNLDRVGIRRRDAAISSLIEFKDSKGDNIQTVRSFIRQILAPFLDPALDFVSDPTAQTSVGDLIIRDGKWVLLDIPKSKLSISRFLSTLVKVLFASSCLNRFNLYPGNDRRVFLIADEYAEIASDLPGEGFGDNYFFSQARQFRVLSIVATQGIPMLENSGVRETWKCILTNSAGKVLFRVGDPDTAELAAKLLGEGDVLVTDHGIQHSGDSTSANMGFKLERMTQLSSDLFLTGLQRGELAYLGLTDGTGRASIRFVKVS